MYLYIYFYMVWGVAFLSKPWVPDVLKGKGQQKYFNDLYEGKVHKHI